MATSANYAQTSTTATTTATATIQPIKVNIGDPSLIKHVLDEHVASFVLKQGYHEDVYWSNIKIGLSVIALAVAAYSQFGLDISPASYPLLKVCVLSYIGIQILLFILPSLLEPDCILITVPRRLQHRPNEPVSYAPALLVLTDLPRYETEFTWRLGYQGKSSKPNENRVVNALKQRKNVNIVYETTFNIADYFDVDGVFLKEKLDATLNERWKEFKLKDPHQKKTQ